MLGLVLLFAYKKWLPKLHEGTIFAIFLVALFGLRFVIEFIKEPQVAFEETMTLNMGQLLSVPFILAGIVLLVWSVRSGGPAMLQQHTKSKSVATHYAKSLNNN